MIHRPLRPSWPLRDTVASLHRCEYLIADFKLQNGGTNCPACRGISIAVTPSRALQSMADLLTRSAPWKARTTNERMQADDVYRAGVSLRVRQILQFRHLPYPTSSVVCPIVPKPRFFVILTLCLAWGWHFTGSFIPFISTYIRRLIHISESDVPNIATLLFWSHSDLSDHYVPTPNGRGLGLTRTSLEALLYCTPQ